MLGQIRVRDYAIIHDVELEFGPGMTVLTGETGAGKSILVDALGLVLGDRADAGAVRHGAERAEITATFELGGREQARAWLAEHDLDAEEECVLRRVIGREGRSRAYINGSPVTLQTLRELGESLVEIHGQHEHQTLTRQAVQREILDAHGGLAEAVAAVASAWERWHGAEQALARARAAGENREHRLDLVRYQLRELEALDLQPGEARELEEEHRRLANTGRLAEAAAAALEAAYEAETGAAQALVARARDALERVLELDPALAAPATLMEEAEIRLREAAETLRRYLDDLDADPGRREAVEARRAGLRELARKHQVEPGALPGRLETLREELSALEGSEAALEGLERDLGAAEKAYLAAAGTLSQARRTAADRLGETATGLMRQLGMPEGRFEIRLESLPGAAYAAHGMDRVEFLVTANSGQPPAPLAKVASGGELSRISLALQVAATGATCCACLVFDEVDAGVGGAVAEIVGRRLRELAAGPQVLCVTHLPQVASQGHRHVRVAKLSDGRHSRTAVTVLGHEDRIEELARMLGGVEITATTRRHAREMIERGGAQDSPSVR